MLQSVQIANFRGFAQMALADFGRVNLIVGKNNTGKTSLLEALALTADPDIVARLDLFRANPGAVRERFYPWLVKDGARSPGATLSCQVTSGGWHIALVSSSLPQPPGVNYRRGGAADLNLWASGHPSDVKPMRVHAVSVQHREPDSMVDAFAEADARRPTNGRWNGC